MTALTIPTRALDGPRSSGRFPFTVKGFTLIELLIVVVIVGLTASTAIVLFSSAADERDIDMATDRLVDDLSFARARATTHRQPVRVAFDIGHNRYVLLDSENHVLFHPVEKRPYVVNLESLGGGSVRLLHVDFGASDTLVVGSGGTPRAAGLVTFGNDDHVRDVRVSKPSAVITVSS